MHSLCRMVLYALSVPICICLLMSLPFVGLAYLVGRQMGNMEEGLDVVLWPVLVASHITWRVKHGRG